MKKRNRILSAVIVATLGLSLLTGCGSSTKTQGEVKEQEKQNIKEKIPATEYDLVVGGESSYTILIPENATEKEQFAASELQTFFKKATNTELAIVTEGADTGDGSYISVGDTKASQNAGVQPVYEDVKNNGFVLQTVEDDCYIKGYSDIGTRNGVYEWLYYCFDYECYAADVITVTETTDLKLPNFEKTVTPSFEWREATGEVIHNEELTYRMRFNKNEEIYVTGHLTHNSMTIIDPTIYDYTSERYKSWFSEAVATGLNGAIGPAQLCYSNVEMREEYVKNLESLLADTEASVMLMGMEDNREWCTCSACTESKEIYGTNAASVIKFANYVQEKVNEWCAQNRPNKEPVRLIVFAYYETEQPPVKYDETSGTYVAIDDSVKLHEDLGVMYAPILATYAAPFTAEVNSDTAKYIQGWGALTDNLHAWTYSLQTYHRMIMHDTFEVMQQNYQFLIENGTISLYDQTDSGQEKGNTAWCRAKEYVMSKLQWNVNLNQEELLDDFFANYFDVAGDTMSNLFNEQRRWMVHAYSDLGATGRINDDLMSTDYWTYPMLKKALSQIDQAYEEIKVYQDNDAELYKKLNNRITLESLQYRYLMIGLYDTNFAADELLDMKYAFKSDAERLEIKESAEHVEIAGLWKEWGIQ